jgi:hypothetical protein
MIEAGASSCKAGYWFKVDVILEKGIIQKKTEGCEGQGFVRYYDHSEGTGG